MNQERTKHRLTRHLQSVADGATVPESSPDAARHRAHQRTVARRRGVTAGLAAASVAGVVAGVSILSTPASTRLQTSDEATAPQAGPDVAESAPPNAVTVPPAALETSGAIQRDAVAADPAFVWKVVEPGKDNSVIGTFSGTAATSFPTLIVSTGPGRSNDDDSIETVVWQTDDGIEFTRSDLSSPFPSGSWQPEFVGEDVFSVGTAPGVAASDPNPLQVAVNGVAGADADWRSVDLPIDTNEFAELPMSYSSLEVTRIPFDNRLLVVATPRINPDYTAIARSQGLDENFFSYWNDADRGIEYADAECISRSEQFAGGVTGTTVVDSLDSAGDTVPAIEEDLPPTTGVTATDIPVGTELAQVVGAGSDAECPTQYISWEDAGVPAETIAALDASATRFFTVDAQLNIAEIESPMPGADFVPFAYGQDARFFDISTQAARDSGDPEAIIPYFEFDGTGFVSGEATPVSWLNQPAPFGDGVAGMSYTADGSKFTVLDGADTLTETDLRPILGENTYVTDAAQASTATVGERLVSVVGEYPDPIAEAGGTEVTVDGITVRKEGAWSNYVFTDTATGEVIGDDRIEYSFNGSTIVLAADGSTMATLDGEELYEALEAQNEVTGQEIGHFSVLTTVDGEAFSVESVAELLGLGDDDVDGVARVVTDGTTVTVTVTLDERYDDDTRKQLILVGTPIG